VFKNEIGQPPKMWATHPANDDRERNIKARYIPAALDERPAWDVFVDAQSLRERVTATVFQGQLPDPAPIEESLRRVDKGFARQSFDRRYRGSFLGRSIVLHARQVGELYDAVPAGIDLRKALATLYGDAHDQDLDRCRQLRQEQSLLEALHAGYLSAPGGLVRWRGSDRPKRDVPELMAQVQAELAPLEDAIRAHDRRCRSLHLGAAEQIGNGWAPYLKGLLATLHYAEHAGADIDDANGVLSNTYRVVLADNQVSANELNRLLSSCNVLQSALGAVYERKSQLHLCPELCARLGIQSWSAALGEFNLPMATKDNINSWFNAIHSWLNATRGALSNLSSASLELLLETEQRVERAIADGQALTAAPPAPSVPADYPTLVPGQERKRPDKLSLWDRFQLADGWIAGAARFGVAASIVGSVLLLGARTESTYLHVYNGLGVDVVVDIDGVTEKLAAGQSSTLSIPGGQHQVRTQTIDGELIEAFDAESARAAQMVYNIAGAAPLIEWTMVYGNAQERPERMLGPQRWVATGADHVFEDPPESITTRGDGGIRTVLSVTSDPTVALARTSDETQRAEMRRQHALWDSADSPDVVIWLRSAQDLPDFPSILDRRLQRNPEDVPARRAQQDAVDGDQKNQVCAEHDAAAKANSASANAAYLAIRCMPDGPEKSAAFLKAHERWPEHPWLHFAAAMVHSGNAEWERAATMLETSLRLLPQMAEPTRNALLRLSRLLGTNAEREKQLANGGAYFAYQLSLETAEGWNASSGAHAFPLLIRGELDAAIERVGSDSEFGNLVRVLVAASDGASEEHIRAGLAVADDQALSLPVLGSAAALALREGGDASVPLAALRQSHDAADVDQLERFLISLHQGEAPQSAADRLGQIDLELRGAAYAAAAVLLGERCPHDWRQQAKALLLGFERPFLR
jgi:hypothetical protein